METTPNDQKIKGNFFFYFFFSNPINNLFCFYFNISRWPTRCAWLFFKGIIINIIILQFWQI